MDTKSLFNTVQLPDGFEYPQSFIAFMNSEPPADLKPWWFLHEYTGTTGAWLKAVRQQYPDRKLVPFAKIEHTDDVACFDASVPSDDPVVYYVHTYASPGWEDCGHVANFDAWLKAAIEYSLKYKTDDAKDEE